jgi:hypothetical protein
LVVASGEARVAAAEDRQVAGEDAAADLAADQDLGLVEEARAEAVEGRGGGDDLGVRGEDARGVGVEGVDRLAARKLDDVDAELGRHAARGGDLGVDRGAELRRPALLGAAGGEARSQESGPEEKRRAVTEHRRPTDRRRSRHCLRSRVL